VRDLAFELPEVVGGHPKAGFSEVADDSDHLLVGRHPVFVAQLRELLLRSLANQDVDRVPSLQQVGDQEAADESGRAADEIRHDASLGCTRRRALVAPVSV
jgi:hypothetical protein